MNSENELELALNQAKLEKEEYKSSLSELQKILDLGRVISSSQSLTEILDHLLFLLSDILPSRGCAVFINSNQNQNPESQLSSDDAPILTSHFTPALQQTLAQHFEEGIVRWILNERRVCHIPSFEENASSKGSQGDFVVIPLNDNDKNYGFIWIACTIKQEEVTAETTNLIWVLSSHASIAIANCLHRQQMEERINELKLFTAIHALKNESLQLGLPHFFRAFEKLICHELKLSAGFLLFNGIEISKPIRPLPHLENGSFIEHGETQKIFRLADKEKVRIEGNDFFRTNYPGLAQVFNSAGCAVLSLSAQENHPAYLLIPLSPDDLKKMPMLQNLLPAVTSQARVMVENLELYDSLLSANRNLTALQWQLVNSGKMAALGQLAGGVAHEINNPLQIMLGRIQMTQLMSGENSKIKDELNLVTEEILRIRDIVRNLLDFSRQGKRETALAPVIIQETIHEVLALLRHQLISNQVEVKENFAPENLRILGNKNQIKQVLLNLIINAIHAMENQKKSTLFIDTYLEKLTFEKAPEEMVVIKVRDSGIGIAQENLDHIFEPFFSTKNTGTGLGLSISYGIIKEHKGNIEVESQESRGTCFTIQIPKMTESALGYSQLIG